MKFLIARTTKTAPAAGTKAAAKATAALFSAYTAITQTIVDIPAA